MMNVGIQCLMCRVTAKVGLTSLTNPVVLLKVVVCGTMLELVRRTLCVLDGVKHSSCSLG